MLSLAFPLRCFWAQTSRLIAAKAFSSKLASTHFFSVTFRPTGIYMSQFPVISFQFGKLIVSRVLPGRVETIPLRSGYENSDISDEFDSRKVDYRSIEHSVIHVFKNQAQILPLCVLHCQDDVKPGFVIRRCFLFHSFNLGHVENLT